jgi:hypothetical protein
MNPEDSISIVADPGQIRLFVAGGPGLFIGLFSGGGMPPLTRKIELPAHWDKLVAKYKDIVPTHIRY